MSDDSKMHGQTVISVKVRTELEKLTESIYKMMENMRKMQNPIMESHSRLPRANQQLDKINSQTEAAVEQMLDMVEQIIEHQEKIQALSGDLHEFLKRSRSKDRDIYVEKSTHLRELSAKSQNHAFHIMNTLQFQDITSQQMNHASELLDDIEDRLQRLLSAFKSDGTFIVDSPRERKTRAFDPDADFIEGRDQKEVDKIVMDATRNNK